MAFGNRCKYLAAVLPLFFSLNAICQQPNFWHRGGFGVWLGVQKKVPVGKRFIWQSDVQLRFRNYSSVYDYTLMRTGMQFQMKKGMYVGGGLVYGLNNPLSNSKIVWAQEFRTFEEFRKNFSFQHDWTLGGQLRLEQRWFENQLPNGGGYDNAFAWRTRFRADVRKAFGPHWRLLAGDELMYHTVKEKTLFNQNRVWLGAGYALKWGEFQLALMQIIVDADDLTVLRLNFLF
jgi:hypothetical protein